MAPVGLCVTQQRRILLCNPELEKIFGFRQGALHGESLERLYPSAQEFARAGDAGFPGLATRQAYCDERIMKRADGHLFWCRVSGRYADRANPHLRAVWVFEDISDRRKVDVRLTGREREIARELARGATSKEIGRSLGISHRTVESNRRHMGRKLGARSFADLISKLVIQLPP